MTQSTQPTREAVERSKALARYYRMKADPERLKAYKAKRSAYDKARRLAGLRDNDAPSKKDKATLNAWTKAYRKKPGNRIKERARAAVSKALRTGSLTRGVCEKCDSIFTQAHHPDYSKPLDVIWLCPKHHTEAHNRAAVRLPNV